MAFFYSTISSICFAQNSAMSTWDFYTKYLANATSFKATHIGFSNNTVTDMFYGSRYYYPSFWATNNFLGVISSSTDLIYRATYEATATCVSAGESSEQNRFWLNEFHDFDSFMSKFQNYSNKFNYLSKCSIETIFSSPILDSNGKIIFYCFPNNDCFVSMNNSNYETISHQLWSLESFSDSFTLTKHIGNIFNFSGLFMVKNFDYKLKYRNEAILGKAFPDNSMSLNINEISLEVDLSSLIINDEFGEWQWNDEHTVIWVDSKGKGILNSHPIKFVFEHDNFDFPTENYALYLEGDFNQLSEDRSNKMKDGSIIYELMFNFGEGNVPLTFMGISRDNNRLQFATYNRFKDEANFEAEELLNQIKDSDYCVLTMKYENNKFQNYVFRIEGLETILEYLK